MANPDSKSFTGSQQATMPQYFPDTQLTMLTPEKPLMSATVVSPEQVTPSPSKKIMNAPVMKAVNNKSATNANEEPSTTYITRVQYRRKVTKSPDVIKFMKIVSASLTQYDKSVQLLPFSDNNKNNPLVTPRDIPDEVEEFQIYVPYAQVTKRGMLFMRFMIQSDTPLWELKQNK